MEFENISINFNVIDYDTGKSKYEVVDFPIPKKFFDECTTESVRMDRIDNYVTEFDKSDLIISRNWRYIIDWTFEKNEDTIKKFYFSVYGKNKEVLKHIDIAYSYLKDSISDLSPEQQIKIINSSINLAIAGINETIKRLSHNENTKRIS